MKATKKKPLPFDKSGGVLVIGRRMLESSAYKSLSASEKVILILMQQHWSNDKYVSYGCREASEKTPCSKGTALKAFKKLENRGFIQCTNEAYFDSKQGSKTREWRLTWLPFNDKPPTNEWERWTP